MRHHGCWRVAKQAKGTAASLPPTDCRATDRPCCLGPHSAAPLLLHPAAAGYLAADRLLPPSCQSSGTAASRSYQLSARESATVPCPTTHSLRHMLSAVRTCDTMERDERRGWRRMEEHTERHVCVKWARPCCDYERSDTIRVPASVTGSGTDRVTVRSCIGVK